MFAGGRPAIFAILAFLQEDVQVAIEETEYTPYFDLLQDLRLGAALGLVGQVEIFEPLLGVGVLDVVLQFRRQLALFLDAGQHGGASLLQFAQIAEPLFERAQLGVVEAARDLLAVTGDEGHGRALVEQLDGGENLGRADTEFLGDAMFDGGKHESQSW